jgi:hypothetical protein
LAAREPWGLLASGALFGLAGAWIGVGTSAWMHAAVPEGLRDRAVAAQLAVRTAGGVGATAAAGVLYALDSGLPWVVAGALFGAGAIAALAGRKGARGS